MIYKTSELSIRYRLYRFAVQSKNVVCSFINHSRYFHLTLVVFIHVCYSRYCLYLWKKIDRLLISAGFLQGKGSSLQLICNAHTVFLICEPQIACLICEITFTTSHENRSAKKTTRKKRTSIPCRLLNTDQFQTQISVPVGPVADEMITSMMTSRTHRWPLLLILWVYMQSKL